MPYTPIVATLGYVLSPDRQQVLLVHRNARAGRPAPRQVQRPGRQARTDEDVVAGMRREIREEAGIDCEALQLRGTISWPGFGKHGEDWFGFVFVITRYRRHAVRSAIPKARWNGSRWTACTTCRCGKATGNSCRWCSTTIRAPSTA